MKHLFQILTLGVLLFSTLSVVSGQPVSSMDEDPMGKPGLWAQLSEDPNNDAMWEEYYGKDLFSFTRKEYKAFEKMKRHLLDKYEERQKQEELDLIQKRDAYLSKRYRNVADAYYQGLVQNINRNFPIIEEHFEAKFNELGDTYLYYIDVYPNRDYSKSKWVDEQEAKIMELQQLLKEYGEEHKP